MATEDIFLFCFFSIVIIVCIVGSHINTVKLHDNTEGLRQSLKFNYRRAHSRVHSILRAINWQDHPELRQTIKEYQVTDSAYHQELVSGTLPRSEQRMQELDTKFSEYRAQIDRILATLEQIPDLATLARPSTTTKPVAPDTTTKPEGQSNPIPAAKFEGRRLEFK